MGSARDRAPDLTRSSTGVRPPLPPVRVSGPSPPPSLGVPPCSGASRQDPAGQPRPRPRRPRSPATPPPGRQVISSIASATLSDPATSAAGPNSATASGSSGVSSPITSGIRPTWPSRR